MRKYKEQVFDSSDVYSETNQTQVPGQPSSVTLLTSQSLICELDLELTYYIITYDKTILALFIHPSLLTLNYYHMRYELVI